jgi:DNA-binding XRE family transcriptional regulator
MTEGIRKKHWDAAQYLYDHYVKGDPEMQDLLEKAREAGNVARKIFQMRTQMGYSQEQLAEKTGTSPSTISRLENADYLGHSLQTLRRVAEALEHVPVVEFLPLHH